MDKRKHVKLQTSVWIRVLNFQINNIIDSTMYAYEFKKITPSIEEKVFKILDKI